MLGLAALKPKVLTLALLSKALVLHGVQGCVALVSKALALS